VAGSLVFHGKTVRSLLPLVEKLIYMAKLPQRWLNPPKPVQPPSEKPEPLVQIEGPKGRGH
jgi:hypothetical protein